MPGNHLGSMSRKLSLTVLSFPLENQVRESQLLRKIAAGEKAGVQKKVGKIFDYDDEMMIRCAVQSRPSTTPPAAYTHVVARWKPSQGLHTGALAALHLGIYDFDR